MCEVEVKVAVVEVILWHVPVLFESSVLKIRDSLSLMLSADDW